MALMLEGTHHCNIAAELAAQRIDNDGWEHFVAAICKGNHNVARELTYGLLLDAPDGYEVANVEHCRPPSHCMLSDPAEDALRGIVIDALAECDPAPDGSLSKLPTFVDWYCGYTGDRDDDASLGRSFLAVLGIDIAG